MEDLGDGRIVELIGAAVLSGAYAALARKTPEAERGLMKMHRRWHDRTAILASEVAGAAVQAAPQR